METKIPIYTFEENYHHQTGRLSPHLSQMCFYFREGSPGLFSRARNFSFKVNLWFTHLWCSMAFLEGFVSKKQVFSLIVFLKDRTLLHRICGNRILLGAALCSKLAWWIWFGLSPAQDACHRQDYHIFSKGSLWTFICHRYWRGGPSKICFINFYPCHCWETDIKITHDPTMTLSFQPIPPALFYPTCIDNCLCQFFGVPACQQGSWSVVDPRKFNMDGTNWCFEKI